MGKQVKQEPAQSSQPATNTAREEQKEQVKDRLAAFAEMDDSDMDEGTSTYKKFSVEGDFIIGTFEGIEEREFDAEKQPGKMTTCAIVKDQNGTKNLLAQTIVVNELRKKWDELKEVGFPCKIIFTGLVKPNTPDQYQGFRILFEKKK